MKLNRLRTPPAKKQQGLALVTVMMVIALCVIIAAELTTQQSFQIKRAQNLFERQQAFWYAMSSEHFVKALLQDTAEEDDGQFNLSQAWATKGMSFPIDEGLIEGEVADLNSCFNVNSLFDEDLNDEQKKFRKEVFQRYLEKLDITSELSVEDLANNLQDWLDKDDYPNEAAGYDGDMYTSMAFPYISANSPMAHENELRVVYGFDTVVLAQLKDKVCAIPDNTDFLFNINTMDSENPELLEAILDIDSSAASDIFSERPEEGFKTIDEFWGLPQLESVKNVSQNDNYFTVNSKFFKLTTNAYYNDMKFALTSIIQLNDTQKTKVIARRFGGEIEREATTEDEQSDS